MSQYHISMINLGLDDNKDPVKGPDVIAEAMLKLKTDIGDAEQTQAPGDEQQFVNLPPASRTLAVATESLDDSQDQDEQTMELRQKGIEADLKKIVNSGASGFFDSRHGAYKPVLTFDERVEALRQEMLASQTVIEIDSLNWSRPNQSKETQDRVQVILSCILMANIVHTRGGSKSLSNTTMGLFYCQTVKTPKDLVWLLSYAMSSKTDWNLDFRKLLAKNSSVVKSLRSLVNLNGVDNNDISDEQFLFAISDKELVFILAAWLGMQFEETKTLYQERNPGEDEGPVYCSRCDEAMSESQFQRVHRSVQWHATNDFAALYNNVRDIVQSTFVKLKVEFEKPAEKRASLRREKKKKVLKDYKKSVAYKLISSFKAK